MILNLLNQGGPAFMYTILFVLIVILVLIVKGIIEKGENKKTVSFISSLGLFVVVLGIFAQTIGMINAFDVMENAGGVSPAVIFAGLKVTFLSTAFGMFSFLIARLGIIILIWIKKED